MTDDLVAFLTARLDEDEAAAQACHRLRQPVEGGEVWAVKDYVPSDPDAVQSGTWVVTGPDGGDGIGMMSSEYRAKHIARHDPARVLREVAAKRRTLTRHSAAPGGEELAMPLYCAAHAFKHRDGTVTFPIQLDACPDLRDLAEPYAWHPDYQESWRP